MVYKRSLSNLFILMIVGIVFADPEAIFTEECEADSNCGSGQRCGNALVVATQNKLDPTNPLYKTNYPGMSCVAEDLCKTVEKAEEPSFTHMDDEHDIKFEVYVYDCMEMNFIKKYWYVGLAIAALGIISVVLVFFNIKNAGEKKAAQNNREASYNQF